MRVRGTNPSRDTLTVDREVKEGWDVGGTCCGQGGGEGTIIYMSEMSRRPIAESFHPLSIPSHDQHLRSVFLPLRFQTPINPLRTVLSPELYGVRREPPFFLWIHPSCASSSLSQPRTQHAIHRRTHHPPLLSQLATSRPLHRSNELAPLRPPFLGASAQACKSPPSPSPWCIRALSPLALA
jgi:hypothetical protein